jgi:hypothetical protein
VSTRVQHLFGAGAGNGRTLSITSGRVY